MPQSSPARRQDGRRALIRAPHGGEGARLVEYCPETLSTLCSASRSWPLPPVCPRRVGVVFRQVVLDENGDAVTARKIGYIIRLGNGLINAFLNRRFRPPPRIRPDNQPIRDNEANSLPKICQKWFSTDESLDSLPPYDLHVFPPAIFGVRKFERHTEPA